MTIALLSVSSLAASLIGVGCGIAGIAIGIFAAYFILSRKIGKTKTKAAKIIEEAYAEAKTAKKEAILEAKEEVHKLRVDSTKKLKIAALKFNARKTDFLKERSLLRKKSFRSTKNKNKLKR